MRAKDSYRIVGEIVADTSAASLARAKQFIDARRDGDKLSADLKQWDTALTVIEVLPFAKM